jgi:hypothetical protein
VVKMYQKYLTKRERQKIDEIGAKIKKADTNREVELYKEQIGLILERIVIRREYELDTRN